jgi:hypothetical protein
VKVVRVLSGDEAYEEENVVEEYLSSGSNESVARSGV